MLQETRVKIGQLSANGQNELARKYERRDRIRLIDNLLDEFEQLNLANETAVPVDLVGKAYTLVHMKVPAIKEKSVDKIDIPQWIEALYEVQDKLLLSENGEPKKTA